MLTYTRTITRTETIKCELEVPKDWDMFTSAGNRSITKKAERLVARIEDAVDWTDRVRAFRNFFNSYERMTNGKTMREASDTAVRECVWCFAEKVAQASSFSDEVLDRLWEERR